MRSFSRCGLQSSLAEQAKAYYATYHLRFSISLSTGATNQMELSERQQKTIAAAITVLAALVILATVLGLFWLLARFLRAFALVFLPLAVAGIGALVLQPYYDWLRTQLRLPLPLALAALLLSLLLPTGIFVGFFGVVMLKELADFVSQFPAWWEHVSQQLAQRWPDLQQFFATHPIGKRIHAAIRAQGPMLVEGLAYFVSTTLAAGAGLAQWTSAMLSWVITPVYLVFFLLATRHDRARLEAYLPFLKTETRHDVVFLAHEFLNILVAFFRGQLLIALLQGLLFAMGFGVVGLNYGLLLGFLLGFLNVIPYLGSLVGLGITLPLAYFQEGGGLLTLAAVLGVFAIVQSIEGYVLTPKIMGNRTGLHPMAIIFAVFFWGTALGGILGMILAIPFTAFLVVFWRLAKEKYISELV